MSAQCVANSPCGSCRKRSTFPYARRPGPGRRVPPAFRPRGIVLTQIEKRDDSLFLLGVERKFISQTETQVDPGSELDHVLRICCHEVVFVVAQGRRNGGVGRKRFTKQKTGERVTPVAEVRTVRQGG